MQSILHTELIVKVTCASNMASLVTSDRESVKLSANPRANQMSIDENYNSGDSDDDEEEEFEEEFCEITTSEGEPYDTSDEEDAELLQAALESAYTCSPFKQGRDPAERSSYLLLDKDLIDEDEMGTVSLCVSQNCILLI